MGGAETGTLYIVYKILSHNKSFNMFSRKTVFGHEGWKRKKSSKMQLRGGSTWQNEIFILMKERKFMVSSQQSATYNQTAVTL